MKKIRLGTLWIAAVVLGLAPSASGKKIIADSDLCGTTSTSGELKCCGPSGKCHTYTGCSSINNGPFSGAWSCDMVDIRCGKGSGNNFSKCKVTRKADTIKKPGKKPSKKPPKKSPAKKPTKGR